MTRYTCKLLFLVSYLLSFSYTADDVGDPLILTPYITSGLLEKARDLSRVDPQILDWPSYTGYFTVNEECGTNIFFWFIPAKTNWESAPLLLWLQGGPGGSSMFGLFVEIGPFNCSGNVITAKDFSWTEDNNVIFIDQPAGTGFSYSEKKCYAQNMTIVTKELYSALKQFFQLFPELQENEFFITGESFAGHYAPHLAWYIHNNNPEDSVTINLAGIFVGNPLTKLTCHNYAHYLYQLGIVDETLRDVINRRHDNLTAMADKGKYFEAWENWFFILNTLMGEQAGMWNRENVVNISKQEDDSYITYMNDSGLRKQIHVGNKEFNDISWDVYNNMVNTIAEPMTDQVEQLLDNGYNVGFYGGNLDIICLYTSTECMLRSLEWSGAEEYRSANRSPWYVNNTLCGWTKKSCNLWDLAVRDAGHSVPFYQPEVMQYLISLFVSVPKGVNPGSLLNTTCDAC